MVNLYKAAVRTFDSNWHDNYKDICEKVRAVNDWSDPNDATDDLLQRLIYDTSNGVASVGQAFTSWPTPRPAVGEFRDMLAKLKAGLDAKFPSDEVAGCRKMFMRLTGNRGAPSIFNRIVAAFLPGKVSPVMFENDFNDAYAKLAQGGYVTPANVKIGDDPWHSRNVQLMDQLRRLLPDGHVEGATMDIDDYSRGIFVWGVHENINMDDWMIIRSKLGNAEG